MWDRNSRRFEKKGEEYLLIETRNPVDIQILHAVIENLPDIYGEYLYEKDGYPEFECQCGKEYIAERFKEEYLKAVGQEKRIKKPKKREPWGVRDLSDWTPTLVLTTTKTEIISDQFPGRFGIDFNMETACKKCGKPFGEHICKACGIKTTSIPHTIPSMIGCSVTDRYFGGGITCP